MTPAPTVSPTYVKRRGKANKRPRGKGSTFVDRMERAVDEAATNIVDRRKAASDAIGERPFGQTKVSERNQVRRYLLMRDDPMQWGNIIQKFGLKAATDYALRLERLLEKYPEEVSYFDPKPEI